MAKAIAKTAAIAVAAGLTFAGSAGIATDAFAQDTSATATAAQPAVATSAPGAASIAPGTDYTLSLIHI